MSSDVHVKVVNLKDQKELASFYFNELKEFIIYNDLDSVIFTNSDVEVKPFLEGWNYCSNSVYSFESLERSLMILESNKKKYLDELYRLNSLKNSLDFYELTEDQQDNYFEDLNTIEENLRVAEWGIRSVQFLLDLFDVYLDSNYDAGLHKDIFYIISIG